MSDWRDEVWEIHETVVKEWAPGSVEDIRFLALALGGETGEIQNLIKKAWRGDDLPDLFERLREELADARVYLELLSRALQLDLDDCVVESALPKIRRRWGPRA